MTLFLMLENFIFKNFSITSEESPPSLKILGLVS